MASLHCEVGSADVPGGGFALPSWARSRDDASNDSSSSSSGTNCSHREGQCRCQSAALGFLASLKALASDELPTWPPSAR